MTKPELVTFGLADQMVLVLFFVVILGIAAKFMRVGGTFSDFILGGRKLTLPVFVLTLFSTWYGGILGVGEFGFTYGISSWILQGVPYYIFATVFALVFAKRARLQEVTTIPDQLEKYYGKKVSMLGSLFTGVLSCPAPYVLMSAVLLQMITGWALLPCVLIGTIMTIVYLWMGGFKADVATDVFFGILMIFAFALILPFLYFRFGGYTFLVQNLPPLHLVWHGGNTPQFIVMWFFIALWTFVEPSFYQRCYAAKSEKVAVQGILISILFWFVFDVMTISAALYSRAAFQTLDQPMMAFPFLAQLVLPPIWKGLFFAGMLATILSTLNSQLFISGVSLGRDFLWRVSGKNKYSEIQWTRFGMVLSGLICVWMALKIPSVVQLWYTIGTVMVPGLLIAMVSTFFPAMRISSRWMFAVMMGGCFTSLFCLLWGWRHQMGGSEFLLGLEPMFPGLLISFLIWLLGKKQGSVE